MGAAAFTTTSLAVGSRLEPMVCISISPPIPMSTHKARGKTMTRQSGLAKPATRMVRTGVHPAGQRAAPAAPASATRSPPSISRCPGKHCPRSTARRKSWLFWVDVRGSGIDRWATSTNTGSSVAHSSLFGTQVNALMGLTYKVRPNFLVGVVGGYETFNYTEQDIDGKLSGDGWTVGTYLGWNIIPTLRYDAAVTYSGIGYNGTAGTAQGNFDGRRWMVSSGLTGLYKAEGFAIEPSGARLCAVGARERLCRFARHPAGGP